ncbi:MAG: DUF998 domain-containing protein [Sphaerobacteraceae bacterium]|nr:MAG: DUF998 domain-containing protein [Sphaerobacteraceae bacterium]
MSNRKGAIVTQSLLRLGAIAGPIYVFVVVGQVLTRDGFDITRHPVSVLANGPFGWIQVLNFLVVGTFVTLAGLGLRQAMKSGPGHVWGPMLVTAFGIGLIGSGVFPADPFDGFPPGTPAGNAADISTSGILHFAFGGIAFVSLSAACLVFSRRYSHLLNRGMAIFSAATGVLYLVAFVSVAASEGAMWANLALTAAVLLGWIWLTLLTSATDVQLSSLGERNVSPATGAP